MIRAIVTDIEGTTSSLSFVQEVLFPYAREHLGDYIRAHADDQAVSEQLAAVREVPDAGLALGSSLDDAIAVLLGWIDDDRKLTPLKALQGLVWEQGYRQGDFLGHVYADAVKVLRGWHEQGLSLYVYSSGSVHAQQLLFRYTACGDLTPLFKGYFDTRVGAKDDVGAYRAIAATLALDVNEVLFLSDIDNELEAAQGAGFQVWKLVREGDMDHPSPYRQAANFEEIVL